ncbi:glycosyltransferase family 61 protein, partial [Bacteroidia bacterium]|nr:glycosyltransferase family 61 protein [Bacteroidia bacterium]
HKGKVVWHKSKYPHFKKIIHLDKNLIKFNEQVLYVDKPKKIINISSGFSLCGVHSKVWSHFLVQYLPKIEFIHRVISATNSDLTIIIPEHNDPHIKEILSILLKRIERINIIELKDGEAAKCDKLYYIENTAVLSEHTSYISLSDVIIPKFVLSFLKEKLVSNEVLFPSLKHKPKVPFRKLYIRRTISTLSPLSSMRVLENYIEVEKFFLAEGFELIEPHKYSLDEKRILFSEAKFIVGSYSSGFMNIMFCQPNTKILVFMNFQRIYESYIANLANEFEINLFALTGVDVDPTDIHSSYSISIKKIVNSYKKIV